MNVMIVSSEVFPYAKTGGLADVAGALPIYLNRNGISAKVAMPYYTKFMEGKHNVEDTGIKLNVGIKGDNIEVAVYKDNSRGYDIYFLRYDPFFDRDAIYGTKDGDYEDNYLRFALFSQALLKLTERIGIPDIYHINDWQTGLIPVYIKMNYEFSKHTDAKVLLTIHNIAYQGLFPSNILHDIGFDYNIFHMDGIEFYGKVGYLKGGIVFSDAINTVSPTYAKEIQSPEYGAGLDGILRKRSEVLYGVINGIDYEKWNPETDTHIFKNFTIKNAITGKAENKKALLAATGLKGVHKPLFGIVSRLASQKGFDLFAKAADKIFKNDIRMVVLGSGDKRYNELFEELARQYPDKIYAKIGVYDEDFARKIYAASDFFLMPSMYEPCGLGQMIAMRFGTLPVVRSTGGLKDTVSDIRNRTGYGITFEQYREDALLNAIKRASALYKNKKKMNALVKKVMDMDFSWNGSAKKYIKLYREIRKI